jgi:FG-GAP repeat protein/VCBS repeat protein
MLGLRLNALFAVLALVSGTGLALADNPFVEPESLPLLTIQGETPNDTFGWVSENLGDLDHDGAADFIVGAITHAGGGPSAGKAYVYSGRDGHLLNSIAGGASDRMGYAVSSAGDANGDGTPDYAVGAPGLFVPSSPTNQPGRVLLVSGADHSVLWTKSGEPNSLFGADLNCAGDVNGDGRGDIVVGAPTTASLGPATGRVYVLSGTDGSVLWTRDGPAPGIAFGTGVSGLGDLDGDGIPEQGVGARNGGPGGGGLAYVLAGRDGRIFRTLHPSGTAVDFGWFFVHDAGDQDADGVPDMYIGDFNDSQKTPASAGTGRGYVFSGRTGKRIRTLNAEAAGDGFGVGRGIPDVDGDGYADLILAAYSSSAGAQTGGRAYIVSGRTGQTLRRITGAVPGAFLGVDAIGLGDVNGDGLPDYLVTTFSQAYVVPGTPLH